MQFLRTVFWVVLAVVGVIFGTNNKGVVTVALWGHIVTDMPLWLVALIAFLIGLVPMFILYRATRWSMRRRLDAAQRALIEPGSAIPSPATAPLPTPVPLAGDPAPHITQPMSSTGLNPPATGAI